ncbi:MAG: hypothetical protein E5Y03_35720, partial [Mesorhizobium sp.]
VYNLLARYRNDRTVTSLLPQLDGSRQVVLQSFGNWSRGRTLHQFSRGSRCSKAVSSTSPSSCYACAGIWPTI